MKKATENTTNATEDDIRHDTLLNLWEQGASPMEIAQAMGADARDIYPLLREAQIAIVKDRGESHGKKTNNR